MNYRSLALFVGSWVVLIAGLVLLAAGTQSLLDFSTEQAQAGNFSMEGFGDTLDRVNALDVDVQDKYAYVVTRENSGSDPEFYVFDISNPSNPVMVSSLDIGVAADVVDARGGAVVLGTRKLKEEVMIISVNDHANPVKSFTYDIPGNQNATALKAVGSLIYVGTKNYGGGPELLVLDAYNPTDIQVVASYEVGADVNGLDVSGDYIFLATDHGSREYMVIDASDRSNLTLQTYYNAPGTTQGNAIAYQAGNLFGVGDKNGSAHNFFVWNYQVGLGALPPPPILPLVDSDKLDDHGVDVAFYGDRVYVVVDHSGASMEAFEFDGLVLSSIGTYSAGDEASGIAVKDSYVYLSTDHNNRELQVVNPGFFHEPTLTDVNGDGVITVSCLGDSNTKNGNGGLTSWCKRVENTLASSSSAWNVVNHGTNSAVTFSDPNRPDAFEQVSSTLATDNPDHFIMMFGTNDVVQLPAGSASSVPLSLIEQSVEATRDIIALAKNAGVNHVIINIHPPVLAFVPQLELAGHLKNRLQQEFPKELIVDVNSWVRWPEDMIDSVHLSDLGQEKAADRVLEKIGF